MVYDRVLAELSAPPSEQSAVFLPDGSVDTVAAVFDGAGDRIETREAFGERVAAGSLRSVQLANRSRYPGGQAVNAARQAHALGADVTLFGHLDDPVFDLPFETHSMGDPASVTVLRFDREILMLSWPSTAVADWSFEDLVALAAPVRERVEGADAVGLTNWASFPALTTAMREFADWALDAPVVVDPGEVVPGDEAALGSLCDALGALDERCPVVLSADDEELAALAAGLGVESRASPGRERALRAALDIAGVVLHAEERAVAATDDRLGEAGTLRVPNLRVETVRRRTGAGDRFSGALAHALGAGLDPETALGLANACASSFVSRGETTDRDALVSFVERGTPIE